MKRCLTSGLILCLTYSRECVQYIRGSSSCTSRQCGSYGRMAAKRSVRGGSLLADVPLTSYSDDRRLTGVACKTEALEDMETWERVVPRREDSD